jgi:hypothetical protein
MATYFLSGTAADDTGNGLTWGTAKRTMGGILALSLVNGDIIACDKDSQTSYSSTQSWTFPCNLSVVSSTNMGGSSTSLDYALMPTTVSLGARTGNYSLTVLASAGFSVNFYGVVFTAGSSNTAGQTHYIDNGSFYYENCIFYLTGSSQHLLLGGSTTSNHTPSLYFKNCTLRVQTSNNRLNPRSGKIVFENLYVDTTSTVPTGLIDQSASTDVDFIGCDFSNLSNTLVVAGDSLPSVYKFINCKFNENTIISGAYSKSAGHEIYVIDCAYDDQQGIFSYINAKGVVVSDFGNRLTNSGSAQSWLISTTSYATKYDPFITPPIPLYVLSGSSINPYVECIRNNGTAAAYNNDTVWGSVLAKTQTTSTLGILYDDGASFTDKLANNYSPQSDGIGVSAWTLSGSNSPYSFKVDAGETLNIQENGEVFLRLCVAGSVSIYVDPVLRV